jgi:WD repeat-containing protein 68
MLACFGLEDSKTLVLDMRSPGQPVAELVGHQAPLGAIAWGAGGDSELSAGGWIASCGTLHTFQNSSHF